MKPFVYALCLLIPLVVIFVIIDRKDFYSGDAIAVHGNSTANQFNETKVATTNSISPQITHSIKEKETGVSSEQNGTKASIETTPAESKTTVEIRPAAETTPSASKEGPTPSSNGSMFADKPAPIAVPVVSAEDAEKLNAETLVKFEKLEKIRAKERERLKQGYILSFSDPFEEYKAVVLSKSDENQLTKKGYDLRGFKKMELPNMWKIDYTTIPSEVILNKTNEGYYVNSDKGAIRFIGQRINNMYRTLLFELTVMNNSDHSGEIVFGVHASGNLKTGYKTLTTEVIKSKEEKTIEVELSVFDLLFDVAPTISVNGTIILSELKVYAMDLGCTTMEGTILERSVLQDPKKSDYPNCRFTAHCIGNTIKNGKPCPKETALIVEGFENYRVLQNNDIKKGDKVLCTICPFESLPEDYQSTQQSDDLQLFLLESYYVLDIKTIDDFSDNELMPVSGIFFSDGNEDYISLFDRHVNPPLPDRIKAKQISDIQKDYEKMSHLLDGLDDDKIDELNKQFVDAWTKEKTKDSPNYNRVGKYVWRQIDNSFWTLPVGAKSILSKPDQMSQQMLDCFLSLKEALEANGVQLIVSLVPVANDIASRVIVHDFKDVPDIQTATYVKQLSEIGVETIYASDQIIENYNRYPFAFFFPDDQHPHDTTQDVIADMLADRLKRYEIKNELDPTLFSIIQVPYSNDDEKAHFVFPKDCDIGDNLVGKSYLCRDIMYNGEKVERRKDASIMVIGNSFMETSTALPASSPVLLSYKLCSPVDWYKINGYGPFSDILIQLLLNPDSFIKGKKVLIFYVGTGVVTDINKTGSMINISKLDTERVLLNKKKVKGHISLQSNATAEQMVDSKLWGNLSSVEKTVHRIDETGKLSYEIQLNQSVKDIDDSKPIICVVSHTCTNNATCKITINGKVHSMYSSNSRNNARFFNLACELPAGTKEITVEFEGKSGALFAIKDIQIWQ